MSRRRELILLGALATVAALVRWIRWERTGAIFNDGPVFLEIAQRIANGEPGAFSHPYHPLYSLLTAALHGLIPDWESAAVAVSIASGSVAVVALHRFVRSAFGPWEAWVAAILLTCHPLSVEFAGDVQSEGLYLALFLTGIALLWSAFERGGWVAAGAAGIACGFAYLTRPEGLGLAVVAGAVFGLRLLRRDWTLARTLALGTCVAIGTAVVALPYVFYLRAETGEWLLTQKKSLSQLAGIQPFDGLATDEPRPPPFERLQLDEDEVAAATPEQRATLERELLQDREELRADWEAAEQAKPGPIEKVALTLAEMGEASIRTLRYGLGFVVLVGVWVLRGRPGRRGELALCVVALHVILLFGLAYNAGYVSRRHVLPPLSVLLGYAGVGILWLGEWLASRRHAADGPAKQRFAFRASVALLALLVVGSLARALSTDRQSAVAERRAAEWLRREHAPKSPVAADKRRVAYYAGAPYFAMDDPPGPQHFARKLYKNGVEYVIMDESKAPLHLSFYRDLEFGGLSRLHCEETLGERACVYRVLGRAGEEAKRRAEGLPLRSKPNLHEDRP